MRKMKMDFQKLLDIICVRKGEKWHFGALLFWPVVFGAKTVKNGKIIVVSTELPKIKNVFF